MPTTRVCERCGQPLSSFAPDGLCANCLLDSGTDDPEDTVVAPAGPSDAHPLPIQWREAQSDRTHAFAGPADQESPTARVRAFADYELIEEIARGGMGVVYKARQVSLNRTVAVKMILSGQLAGVEEIRRFRQEAEAAAALQHPNIVAIHEVGEHEGRHYFSMDFVEGRSLTDLVANSRHSRLDFQRVARYLRQIAEAIHYAHAQGVLHRDLKPSNVLIDANDQPRVTDFGLAKRFGVPPSGSSAPEPAKAGTPNDLTLSGQVLGTPNYMPPEQARGQGDALGPGADIYSLGGILFFLLTGRAPFLAETVLDTLQLVLSSEPLPPRQLNPAVPRDLENICLKCLAKEPERRYATALALAEDLGRWLRGEPVVARPISAWEKTRKWIRRRPVTASLIATLLTCVVLAAFVVSERHRAQHQRFQKEQAELRARLQSAERQFADDSHQALRSLAGILRAYPRDRLAPERLVNALRQRVFLLPCVNTTPAHLAATRAPPRDDTLSPDGRRRAHFSNSVTITVRDAKTDAVLHTISNAHQRVIRSVTWSADGQRLVSASADNTAKIWNATTGARLQTVAHGQDQAVYHAELSPDGTRLLTASRDRTARLWDASNGATIGAPMPHRNAVNTARFNSDGTVVVTASDDRTVRLWSGENGAPIGEPLHLGSAVEDAFFTPDGLHVRVLAGMNALRTFRVASGVGLPPIPASTQAPPFRPLPPKLAALLLEVPRIVPARITFTNASPDGTLLAVASEDKTARILDPRARSPIMVPLLHDAAVNCVRFSPDSRRVATSTVTPNPRARVWDARTGLPLTDWLPSSAPIASVDFSADGRWLIPSDGAPWELHLAGDRSPPWLPDLAEAIAAVNLNHKPGDEAAVAAAFLRLQREFGLDPATDPLTLWAKEFMTDELPNEIPLR